MKRGPTGARSENREIAAFLASHGNPVPPPPYVSRQDLRASCRDRETTHRRARWGLLTPRSFALSVRLIVEGGKRKAGHAAHS